MTSATSATLLPPAVPVPEFPVVYHRYFDFVWRVALGARVPAALLDDVVQETFLAIHRKLPTFEGRSTLRTWIGSIARLTARDFLRRRRHRPLGDELDPDGPSSQTLSPAEATEQLAAARLVQRFLDEMSDIQREAFVLTEMEQLTAVEIGQLLGVNEHTIRTRLRGARKSFAASLARHRSRERWWRAEEGDE